MNPLKMLNLAVFILFMLFLFGCSSGKNTDLKYFNVFNSDYSKVSFDEEIFLSPVDSEKADFVSGYPFYAWGLKRNPGGIPEFSPAQTTLLRRYNGLHIGDTTKKEIFLTFDEGYENGYTNQILDVLKKHDVKAVFFITGPYLKTQQQLVARMVDEGHEVGNHTIHHPSLPSISDDDIENEVVGLDRAFYEAFSKNMRFLRPPKGEFDERSLMITSKLGFVNLFWSFAYDDWDVKRQRGPQYAYDIVNRNIHNGAVILLHAVSSDNANALDMIITQFKSDGYVFGSPNELYDLAVGGGAS